MFRGFEQTGFDVPAEARDDLETGIQPPLNRSGTDGPAGMREIEWRDWVERMKHARGEHLAGDRQFHGTRGTQAMADPGLAGDDASLSVIRA